MPDWDPGDVFPWQSSPMPPPNQTGAGTNTYTGPLQLGGLTAAPGGQPLVSMPRPAPSPPPIFPAAPLPATMMPGQPPPQPATPALPSPSGGPPSGLSPDILQSFRSAVPQTPPTPSRPAPPSIANLPPNILALLASIGFFKGPTSTDQTPFGYDPRRGLFGSAPPQGG